MTEDHKWTPLKRVRIEARPTGLWSVVTDYVPGSRLLRFSLLDKDPQNQPVPLSWNPAEGVRCGADGIGIAPGKSGLLTGGALYGALIAKIGGSSADIPDASQPTSPYGSKRVFGVGSHCVISLASTEGGPLFLTMNDNPEGFVNHAGALHVLIEEYST
ncbi:MAG TPA: hypothetical protein VE377_06765 [Candidatus Dormibacteraeota bacterium]|nr:hypothetical protein [Candidatus Dormibacteraeota bacterium]